MTGTDPAFTAPLQFRVVVTITAPGADPVRKDMIAKAHDQDGAKREVVKALRALGYTTGRVHYQWFGQHAL